MLPSFKSFRYVSVLVVAVLLFSALALAFASPARAAEIITGDPDAVLPAGEVVEDDLFIAGQSVRIEGIVHGDVFAGGNDVTVTGQIDGNLFVGAQWVSIDGTVDGSVIAFAYAVAAGPAAMISDNLYGFGFSVRAEAGSQIGRSVYAFGYQGVFDGGITRDVNFQGAAFNLNGAVGRNLFVRITEPDRSDQGTYGGWMSWMPGDVEAIEPGYLIGSEASIGGEEDYQTVEVGEGVVDHSSSNTIWGFGVAAWLFSRAGEFLALFVVGLFLVLLWPNQVKKVEGQITLHGWRSLGLGLLLVILTPIAFVLGVLLVIALGILFGIVSLGQLAPAVFTIGLLLLGLATAAVLFAGFFAAKSVFGHLLGERVFGSTDLSLASKRWQAVLALLVGLLIYAIVRLIPILGWLVGFVIMLVGLGAIVGALWLKEPAVKRKHVRKAKAK